MQEAGAAFRRSQPNDKRPTHIQILFEPLLIKESIQVYCAVFHKEIVSATPQSCQDSHCMVPALPL